MALIDAWDKTTGERVPYLVPAHHVGHKILGPNLVSKPPKMRVAETDNRAGNAAGKEKK